MASGKAPGNDRIPPELIKHCKTTLLLPLHEVLYQCWQEGAVPQDTRDSKIITLYKNKGERSDCNNYRGISQLSIVGKVFARVILIRLQKLAERIYPESQCGFRAERSTIDMVFSLLQLQEKCREQHMPLYIAFIDLTKAFDLVSRDGLFKVLPKIDKRIGKAASTLARLTARVWTSPKLSVKTKMAVYNACVSSTLLYGSETWTTYAGQERRLNSFHLRSIRRILGISWQDKVTNADVLSRAGLPTMYTLLRQRRLRWLGHVRRMEDGRIPKDILYGELALGRRTTGRPHLRYKDVCARDMKAVGIDTMSWEGLAADRTGWRSALKQHLKTGEDKLMTAAADKRARRKEGSSSIRPTTTHICVICNKDCHSHIGLFSHKRRCYNPATN